MKYRWRCIYHWWCSGRSREGAWIEIAAGSSAKAANRVAPVRERGLKLLAVLCSFRRTGGRSREGAWIEITASKRASAACRGRSREGAWIEIEYIIT